MISSDILSMISYVVVDYTLVTYLLSQAQRDHGMGINSNSSWFYTNAVPHAKHTVPGSIPELAKNKW